MDSSNRPWRYRGPEGGRTVGVLLLNDIDPYVRSRAAYTLSEIGQPVVPVLIRVVEQGRTEAKPSAVATFGGINDPLAIAPLIRALGDEDERGRSEALVSLVQAETNVLERFLQILSHAGAGEPGILSPGNLNGSETVNGSVPGKISLTESDLRDYLMKALENTEDPSFRPLIRDILSGFEKK